MARHRISSLDGRGIADFDELIHKKIHRILRSSLTALYFDPTTLIEIAVYRQNSFFKVFCLTVRVGCAQIFFLSFSLSFSYVWSGFIVLLGIFLNVYSKNERPINAWFVQQRNKYSTYFSRRQQKTPQMENV